MSDPVETLLDRWVYDIDGLLLRRLQSLVEDRHSGDAETRRRAAKQMEQLFEWRGPPLSYLTDRERLQRIGELSSEEKLSPAEKLAEIRSVLIAPRRRPGRPRTDGPEAIQALTLHLKMPLTWCEIAKQVKGCEHPHSDKERSCPECGDAIRDAVGQLEKFLCRIGLYPDIDRRKAPDASSRPKRPPVYAK